MQNEEMDRPTAGRVLDRRHGLDTGSLRIRALLGLGALGLFMGLGWIASRASQETALHRLRVEKELREIAAELAEELGRGDAKELAFLGQGFELTEPPERLEALGGLVRVEPLPAGWGDRDGTSGGRPRLEVQALEEAIEANENAHGDAVVSVALLIHEPGGEAVARLRAVAPARPPGDRFALQIGLMGLFVVSLLAILLALVDRVLASHCSALRALAEGRTVEALDRNSSREVIELALALRPRSADATAGTPSTETATPLDATSRESSDASPSPAEELETPTFSPRELTREVALALDRSLRARGVELVQRVEERVPERIPGPPAPVLRALHALARNAAQCTRRGSVRLRISLETQGRRLRFEVLDTGSGLAAREQDALRRELDRVRPADLDRAPGLTGVHLAQAIARSWGGRVEFDSQRGAGSRFWFSLPYAPSIAEPSPGAVPAALPSALSTNTSRSASTASACFATS